MLKYMKYEYEKCPLNMLYTILYILGTNLVCVRKVFQAILLVSILSSDCVSCLTSTQTG